MSACQMSNVFKQSQIRAAHLFMLSTAKLSYISCFLTVYNGARSTSSWVMIPLQRLRTINVMQSYTAL